jgi:hypothetical protein
VRQPKDLVQGSTNATDLRCSPRLPLQCRWPSTAASVEIEGKRTNFFFYSKKRFESLYVMARPRRNTRKMYQYSVTEFILALNERVKSVLITLPHKTATMFFPA